MKAGNFQVIELAKRKAPKVELFLPTEREAIYRRWLCREKTIWELAREHRVSTRDIDEVIKGEMNRQMQTVRQKAFREGRQSMMPKFAA